MGTSTFTFDVRDARRADSEELADLLNAIIAKGGMTALEMPYTADQFAETFVQGASVHCCFVAFNRVTERIEGFQTLIHYAERHDQIGDIATFVRLDGARRGVGMELFGASRARATTLGLSLINATIRADNAGGLAFYARLGFVDHGVFEGVPLRDGRRVDRVIKRYALVQAAFPRHRA